MDTKQLKQRILDLAIRGKLVPQDPNDEPASVLLERIRAEKEQLIAQGKLKKSKTKASDKPHYENVPFEIPESWEWVTLDFVCSKIGSGSTPKGSNYSESGIPFFRSQNVYNDGLVFEDIKYISEQVHQSMIGTEVKANDLLLNITGGSLGRCAIVPLNFTQGNVSQHVCILRPIVVLSQYIHAFILSAFFAKTMKITGSGREGLPKYNLEKMIFPLPPLAEQQRIAAEVEKWFALIDELEVNKEDLTEYIKQVKSKVLDLAIHGKLVPQDPNDEPAIELLKRINPNFKPCDTSHYENLPAGWTISSINDIGIKILNGYAFKSSIYRESGIKVIRITNVQDGYVCDDDPKYYPTDYANELQKYMLHENDLLMSLTGNVGRVGFLPKEMLPAALNQRVGCLRGADKILSKDYLYYYLQSNSFKQDCLDSAKGVAQLNISTEWLKEYQIALPPYAEQLRIVKKISVIFNLIDSISAEL